MFEGKKIIITGGTGSLGKVVVKRILSGEFGNPRKVIIFSRDEAKQHYMRVELGYSEKTGDGVLFNNFSRSLEFRIGDIRDRAEVFNLVKDGEIIIHAAAMKQVPACEYFPYQSVLTNIIGAQNIVDAVNNTANEIETVVGISTDKACKPVNVMGMTKSLQERIFTAANISSKKAKFVGVRYGNVLASRGSVIPLFHDQLLNKLNLTITVPEMTRFLLTLSQATDTVFAAIKDSYPGEILVPNAPAASILNIANALIEHNGGNYVIKGIRPGEKLHELMVSEEECGHTVKRNDHYVIMPMLPELINSNLLDEKNVLGKEFSSFDNLINYEDTVDLLRINNILKVKDSILI